MKTTKLLVVIIAITLTAYPALAQHYYPGIPNAASTLRSPPQPPMPPGIPRHQPDTTIIIPPPANPNQLTEGFIINNNTGSITSYSTINGTTIINTY